MKPDQYMPFYGDAFFQAVEGQPDCIVSAYVRALWHYWSHNHAKGLENDDQYLRRVCRTEVADWLVVKPVIFGRYFTLHGHKWHQKRSLEEWTKAERLMEKRRNQTEAARTARWGK